jgi:hypothetical protein
LPEAVAIRGPLRDQLLQLVAAALHLSRLYHLRDIDRWR